MSLLGTVQGKIRRAAAMDRETLPARIAEKSRCTFGYRENVRRLAYRLDGAPASRWSL